MPRGPLLLSAAACVFASTTLILTTYTLILTPPSSGKVDARILELLHSLEGQLRTHTGASEAGQTAEHVFLEKVSKLEKELEEARAQLVTPRLKNEQTKFLALIGVPLRISDSALRDSIRLGWAQYPQVSPCLLIAKPPQVCQRVPKCAATCSVHVRFVLGIEGDGSKEDALLLIEQENKTHGDLVFLPEVRDKKGANMDHSSKMWRWISHAAEHFAHFTFLVKADSDTFVFVDSLLKQLVPLPPVQVYGGMPVGWLACGAEPHCPQNYVYAAGALEVLSLDVASWISRSEWIKAQEPHGPEDLLLGKWLIEPESTAQHDFHTGWFPIVNCWLHEKRFKHAQGHLDMAKDPAVSAAVNVPCGS